jgi:hypothetical protein
MRLTPARPWLALIPILLLAAALRWGWPGVNSFAFDEARLSLIALDMARGGRFAFLGMPSSVGVPNLPAAAWVYALPYAVSPDPLIASLFTGGLSLLAVAGAYALARAAWGPWAGVIAALFMAASPYAVLYARSVWAQNLLPPLALAWGMSAWLGAARHSRAAIALNVFLAGFAWQVHFAAITLILGTLYCFVRFRWWRRLIPALVGGAGALLAFAPFVWHVACCAPGVIDQYRAALGGPTHISADAARETLRLALGWDWGYLAAGRWTPPLDPALPSLLAGGLLLLGGAALARTLLDERGSRPALLAEIVLIWLVISPLFFARHSTPVFIHYQLIALPAAALTAGLAARVIRRRWWPPLLAALMAVTALLWALLAGLSLDEAGRMEHGGGLGTPLHIMRGVARAVPDDLPVLFFTHGDDLNVDGEVAVFSALWWGRDHRIIQGESLLVLPPQPAYLLATLAPFQAWEEIIDGRLAGEIDEYPRRAGEGPGFVGVRYDGRDVPQGFARLEQPIPLQNGIQLEGWKARMVGPRLRISTLWRVQQAPPPGIYQQFHHLRTADTLTGEPFGIADVPVTAHNWRVGDRLVVMGDFFVEPDREYWVDTGQYTLPDVQRVPRADSPGDSIRLGPFNLRAGGEG